MVVKILFLDEFFDERKKKVLLFFLSLLLTKKERIFRSEEHFQVSQLLSAAQTSDRHFEEKKLINQLLCLRII